MTIYQSCGIMSIEFGDFPKILTFYTK